MSGNWTTSGWVAPGFEPVADTFRANFLERGEIGASLCITVEGETVVDLWGGWADLERGRRWEEDTLNVVFSATKGMVATAYLVLEDRGGIDLDQPVIAYWPEVEPAVGQSTVRDLLNHRVGLVGFRQPITLDDFARNRVPRMLPDERPVWRPGTDQGYHGVTFGPYAGELFRRVAGKTVGTFLRDEITGPLGADVFLGLPESEEYRVARLYPSDRRKIAGKVVRRVLFSRSNTEGRVFRAFLRGDSDTRRAFSHPAELGARGVQNFDSRLVRSLELPWASAVGSARGLARVYAALANGGAIDDVRIVRPEAIGRVTQRQTWSDRDRVLQKPMGFSQGYVKEGGAVFSPHPEAFGHPGAGGALGWCDPVVKASIGYVPNHMDWRIRSPRAMALTRSLYESLGISMPKPPPTRWRG